MHCTISLWSFLRNLASKFNKIPFLKDMQTLLVEYTINPFLITRCQKKCYEQGYDILKSLYQNRVFLRNGIPSKIRLLQSYVVVLLIHVIGAICNWIILEHYYKPLCTLNAPLLPLNTCWSVKIWSPFL